MQGEVDKLSTKFDQDTAKSTTLKEGCSVIESACQFGQPWRHRHHREYADHHVEDDEAIVSRNLLRNGVRTMTCTRSAVIIVTMLTIMSKTTRSS